eukprot:TRINITY_DN5230_c3_g1_i1.p1 TRINITY_DN5230_c3_g1~~TRINITY_DN5230_c3_g1_i1.p1  ORF type:complete len:844 (+),score=245.72 TRINITY_DN5230_c3_g1_i1:69-2534(+)
MPGVQEMAAVASPTGQAVMKAAATSADAGQTDEPFSASVIGRKLCELPKYMSDSCTFYRKYPGKLKQEILSAATIAVLQVPESVAFSYVAGVDPVSGMTATAIMGTVTGALGGRPAMVSGAQGAIAAVQIAITQSDGEFPDSDGYTTHSRREILFMSVLLAGAMQIVIGFLQAAQFATLIPVSVMIGFLNGLAIIIFKAQLGAFKKCEWCLPVVNGTALAESVAGVVACSNTTGVVGNYTYDGVALMPFEDCSSRWLELSEGETWMVLLIVAVVMIICYLLPKMPAVPCGCAKVRIDKIIPPAAVALILATVFEHAINRGGIGMDTRTVKDTAPLASSPPEPKVPDIKGSDYFPALKYGLLTALIGLVESLLTLRALDEEVGDLPSSYRNGQECVAQGIGNFLCGFFQSMGGGAMIGQSKINVMNGARGRLSPFLAGITMFVIICALSFIIDLIPIAALTGVLFMVVINTFEWSTVLPPQRCILATAPRTDALTIVIVTVLAVLTDLAEAVAIGTAFSCMCYAWASSTKALFTVKRVVSAAGSTYSLSGNLFAASVAAFSTKFAPQGVSWEDEPASVIIDFAQANITDFSAVAALESICSTYSANPKQEVRVIECTGKIGWTIEQSKCGMKIKDVQSGSAAEKAGVTAGHLLLKVSASKPGLEKAKKIMTQEDLNDQLRVCDVATLYVIVAEPRKVRFTNLTPYSKTVLQSVAKKSICGPPEMRSWLREALEPVRPHSRDHAYELTSIADQAQQLTAAAVAAGKSRVGAVAARAEAHLPGTQVEPPRVGAVGPPGDDDDTERSRCSRLSEDDKPAGQQPGQ